MSNVKVITSSILFSCSNHTIDDYDSRSTFEDVKKGWWRGSCRNCGQEILVKP